MTDYQASRYTLLDTRTSGREDWILREWAALAAMALAKGTVLVRFGCNHAEYFNAGQEPRETGRCTRCWLREAVERRSA